MTNTIFLFIYEAKLGLERKGLRKDNTTYPRVFVNILRVSTVSYGAFEGALVSLAQVWKGPIAMSEARE